MLLALPLHSPLPFQSLGGNVEQTSGQPNLILDGNRPAGWPALQPIQGIHQWELIVGQGTFVGQGTPL